MRDAAMVLYGRDANGREYLMVVREADAFYHALDQREPIVCEHAQGLSMNTWVPLEDVIPGFVREPAEGRAP